MDWGWLVAALVLIWIGLVIWAKSSHQTIGELLGDIKENLSNKKDDATDNLERIKIYG
jgi:hypothetical protein